MGVKIAIIGGTGVYDPSILEQIQEKTVETEFGSVPVKIGSLQNKEVAFITRHGFEHSVPPHLINYRANIAALKKLGVKSIFATAAVGSLNLDMKPGDLVLADQFLDFTKVRQHTFFGVGRVVHLDMTVPYCADLRAELQKAAAKLKFSCHNGGTYVCTEGPRFETPAEIKMFALLGGDLVGMTSVPEVTLAREAEICYATIAMVTNFAAGISPTALTHQEVLEVMAENAVKLRQLLIETISNLDPDRECICQKALQ
ncbi:MAG: S-methyl-5'-thioadenosine phosphorylase [Clostridia bacterium]|nr:S-methyl-5'-thioadenosine phosphorylase [Clostridia bacterium]